MFENIILSTMGFDTHVTLPHAIALTYLQALGALKPKLANRVLEHLNGGLLSPQVLYLTHQPNALAVAAIYLAARETGIKLADGNWWEVFDVEREDLGFLVLAYSSLHGFAEAERTKWSGKRVPLGIDRSP
jgi:cyclin L